MNARRDGKNASSSLSRPRRGSQKLETAWRTSVTGGGSGHHAQRTGLTKQSDEDGKQLSMNMSSRIGQGWATIEKIDNLGRSKSSAGRQSLSWRGVGAAGLDNPPDTSNNPGTEGRERGSLMLSRSNTAGGSTMLTTMTGGKGMKGWITGMQSIMLTFPIVLLMRTTAVSMEGPAAIPEVGTAWTTVWCGMTMAVIRDLNHRSPWHHMVAVRPVAELMIGLMIGLEMETTIMASSFDLDHGMQDMSIPGMPEVYESHLAHPWLQEVVASGLMLGRGGLLSRGHIGVKAMTQEERRLRTGVSWRETALDRPCTEGLLMTAVVVVELSAWRRHLEGTAAGRGLIPVKGRRQCC